MAAMNRRGFIKTATAGLLLPVAPAICRADWLMPVKPAIAFSENTTIYSCVREPSRTTYTGDLWYEPLAERLFIKQAQGNWEPVLPESRVFD